MTGARFPSLGMPVRLFSGFAGPKSRWCSLCKIAILQLIRCLRVVAVDDGLNIRRQKSGVRRRSSRGMGCALQILPGTSGARELFVALSHLLRATTAGKRCTGGRLGDHTIGGRCSLLILFPAVDGVVSFQEVSLRSITGPATLLREIV